MKNIYVYSGSGAYQARDVENCLNVFDIDYYRICEHDITKIKLNSILIIPGGMITSYLFSWGRNGKQTIRNFVQNGGIYVGICAGAYVAGKKCENETGLAFFNRVLNYKKHQFVIKAEDNKGNYLELIAENGPDLATVKNSTVVLKDENNKAQVIEIQFGKGKVYLFSSHPEGSVYYKQLPQEFSGAKWFVSFLKSL